MENIYSEKNIAFIKENYCKYKNREIAEILGIKIHNVDCIARKYNLIKQPHTKWTDKDNEFLKTNYIKMSSQEIAKALGKTVHSVNTQRDRLGLVRNPSWTKTDIQFLINNFEKMTHKELGECLKRTESAIRAKCFELNLYKKELPWTETECQYILDNYREMKYEELAKHLGRTLEAVRIKTSKMGLKKSPYFCNYHYFDVIDSEEKAYWLGFLTADGWINLNQKTGSGTIGIELQYGDMEHLKKFNKSLDGNYKITDRWRCCSISKYKTKTHNCVLRVYSKTMYDSLVKLGFTNNKSFDSYMPKLRKELIRHYIRGYFDGNGRFSVSNNRVNVTFCTASKSLKDDIIGELKNAGINLADYYNDDINGVTIYMPEATNKNEKMKLLDYMYKDCNIYLNRRYKKYLKAKNIYNF